MFAAFLKIKRAHQKKKKQKQKERKKVSLPSDQDKYDEQALEIIAECSFDRDRLRREIAWALRQTAQNTRDCIVALIETEIRS